MVYFFPNIMCLVLSCFHVSFQCTTTSQDMCSMVQVLTLTKIIKKVKCYPKITFTDPYIELGSIWKCYIWNQHTFKHVEVTLHQYIVSNIRNNVHFACQCSNNDKKCVIYGAVRDNISNSKNFPLKSIHKRP